MFSCIKFEVVSALLVSVSSFVVCQIYFDYDTFGENGVCNTDANFACQTISNCPSALEDITNGGPPKICSFEGNEPLVCCDLRRSTGLQQGNMDAITIVTDPSENNGHIQSPFGRLNSTDDSFGQLVSNGPTTVEGSSETRNNQSSDPSTTTTTEQTFFFTPPPLIPGFNNTKSEQKCQEYGRNYCKDASFVFGGVRAKLKQFPHMALIGFGPENDKSWQCGGSLISRRYILSAAHCTFPGKNIGFANWVRLGELDLSTTTDNSYHIDFTIIERINHPRYNPPLSYNDIAVYKVDRRIYFNDFIQPVCLHTTFDILERAGIAAGWGRIEFVGPTSNHLLYANISFVNPDKCKDNLRNKLSKSHFPDGITDSIVCAGEADGSKDTCQGDSGGPLFISQRYPWPSCPYRQVGITSTGLPCSQEDSPGLYTRVSNYIPWIESIVWANDP